jgi:hypothetical protein
MRAIGRFAAAIFCALPLTCGQAVAGSLQAPSPSGWINHPEEDATKHPVVLHFRRDFSLGARPKIFVVRISADNRFILYVNGERVASGPSTGDVAHWRYATIDLAPRLRWRSRRAAAAGPRSSRQSR